MSAYGLDGNSRGSPEKIAKLLEQAQQFKDKGNELYGNKSYAKAIGSYHRALLMLRGITLGQSTVQSLFGREEESQLPEETTRTVKKLVADCNCNLAASLLQQNDVNYDRVVECCNIAIDNQPNNVKAYYRKGMALYEANNYEEALKALLAGKSVCGPNAEARQPIDKYVALCHKAMQQQDQKLKETYKHMFAGISQDTVGKAT